MASAQPASPLPADARLCPYCGHTQPEGDRCVKCRGLFEPLSRQATQNSMGPWQIRDEANPFSPGCSIETIRALIARGRVRADAIVRGPTTHQFWRRADETPGLAQLFGACHACKAPASGGDAICATCGESFLAPSDRQRLGLAPVRALSGPQEAPLSPIAIPTARPETAPPPFGPAPHPAAPLPFEAALSSTPPRRARARGALPPVAALIVVGVGVAAIAIALAAVRPWSSDNQESSAAASLSQAPTDPPVQSGQSTAAQNALPPHQTPGDAPGWRVALEASAQLAASGHEDDIRKALADISRLASGFPEGGAPAEVVAELARLERRLDQAALRRFVW
ncbi:MAG: hypothetical protein IBJ10_07910 [Phycisphaerales bacterium]|nr:hypothetical protein [Phycisphaerales bacterium]